MPQTFPWKRFWCRRDKSYSLGDRGFLVDPEEEHGATSNPYLTSLNELQHVACLALLGESGVGKSWSLNADEEAYLEEFPDVELLRLNLRSYGSEDRLCHDLFEAPKFLQWIAGEHALHLYLDSFDECLLRIESLATLLADKLPQYPLHRLKLRIACRTAFWPPVLEDALKAAYGEVNFAAVELAPLRRRDVLEAAKLSDIDDPEIFLGRIDELQIAALAGKPVTLAMLLQTYRRDGDLPRDLFKLYEKGCLILCEELNAGRRAAGQTGRLSPAARLEIAARIAAITQFGNRFAVWQGTGAEGAPMEDVSIVQLVGGIEDAEQTVRVSEREVVETLGTGLFTSRGEERLGWSHQTLAEYLAARYCLHHGLSITQLRSLVFHPRRDRVIPQIREVASWLALQHEALFAEIAERDPEVLLGSASPSLSARQRELATAELIRASDRHGILHIDHNLNLRNLAYSGLSAQLEPILLDRTRSVETRYFAMQIVRSAEVRSLVDCILAIALSDAESHDLRALATYTTADLGTEAQREQLRPLLNASRENDPDDQLRGAALSGIYPGAAYDDAMWDYLEDPRKSFFFGAYNSFLSYTVAPKLTTQNLPVAIQWFQKQEINEIGPIEELGASICTLAVEHIEASGVADALANAILQRCKAFKGFPSRRYEKIKGADELLAENPGLRHRFLEAILPLLGLETFHVLDYPLSLLKVEDLGWFLERIVQDRSPDPLIEAKLVLRLVDGWAPETIKGVSDACRANVTLASECNGLFRPWPLDCEMAVLDRRRRQEVLDASRKDDAPSLTERIDAALARSEEGDADAWYRLLAEMASSDGKKRSDGFFWMKPLELPGWLEASGETRCRILGAAKLYLTESKFPEFAPPPPRRIRGGASAAVEAVWLLQAAEPTFLETRPKEFWSRWIPSFAEDGRMGDAVDGPLAEALRLTVRSAPDVVNRHLFTLIERDNTDAQKHLFCSALLDRAWSESLGQLVLARLQENDLFPAIQEALLNLLLLKKTVGAREWAEEIVQTEHDSERGMALSRPLLGATHGKSWHVLWPLIQTDTAYGRTLIEESSFGRIAGVTTPGFTEQELEELYIWLAEQYPTLENQAASGPISAVDTIEFLRNGVLEELKKRGTFEACDAIAQIELRFPQYRWMRYHFDQAELLACAVTWEAPALDSILALGMDHTKRLVESNEQLLDVLLESLSRLPAELHGELPAIVDLWNNDGDEWWPKQEEEVSDYIVRFLRKDIVDRGIVLNREVQIRRGRNGEMPGQRTDIHVDAVMPTSQAGRYGAASLVIEVKGTWNSGLLTDMQNQLRDRYLRDNDCRIGIYVTAHFSAKQWRRADRRRAQCSAVDIDAVKARLQQQAEELSGSVILRSFVLDASLSPPITSVNES